MIDSIENCTNCGLVNGCKQPIEGEGNLHAKVMVVGEAPGKSEDLHGRPFIGKSGKLLNEILEEAGLSREEVYITNIVKCRPPGNRNPEPEEVDACFPHLHAQIELIKPTVIIALGAFAARVLTEREEPISSIRGKAFGVTDFVVVPTFHPAYILRNRNKRELLVKDIKFAKHVLDYEGGLV